MRIINNSNGDIYEGTFKDGKGHGFFRSIGRDKVYISLYKEGDQLGYFTFDFNFKELQRCDIEQMLSDHSPSDYLK